MVPAVLRRMADLSELDHILGSRMNAEPSILRGCSSTELMLVAGVATLIWVPVGIILAFVVGPIVIGLAGACIVVTVYVGGGVFQKIKRGRPDGFYQHWVALKLHKLGLGGTSYIIPKEGMLRLGRTWQR